MEVGTSRGIEVVCIPSLAEVDPGAWDALVPGGQPFVRHAFLAGLEASGSVGDPATGWLPRHLLARADGALVGGLPLYAKLDSFGEYVFDYAWAEAAARAGLAYYPKLVSAVPFTPVTGPRLLVPEGPRAGDVCRALMEAAWALSRRLGASGLHVLFPGAEEAALWRGAGMVGREGLQFHWARRPGWASFADHLAALRAPARKQALKERRRAQAHGLALAVESGRDMDEASWRALFDFYLGTCDRRGGAPYLTPAFFEHLRAALGEEVVVAAARRDGVLWAAALFLRRGATLWGRTWGARENLDGLHFELCYHLPIVWGLPRGIDAIEAGAQGLHKHKRGFLPALCHSAHRLAHPGMARAVGEALDLERRQVRLDLDTLRAHTPYARQG